MSRLFKRISVLAFGFIDKKHRFRQLQASYRTSGIPIIFKTYLSMMFFTMLIVFIASMIGLASLPYFFEIDPVMFIYIMTFTPPLLAIGSFSVFYLYPLQKSASIRRSIENDLPFAIAHMNAITSSGIPPEHMFTLITGFKEYGQISNHAQQIVKNISTFGMSSVEAINVVAEKTPSPDFREILTGITYTIEKGGNLEKYLKQMSEKSLFDYRIRREKYLKTLSTYADIYTALLVAAPLMLLAVLGILSIIGGDVLGLNIPDLITLMTFIALPAMNVSFIAFIHATYPGI